MNDSIYKSLVCQLYCCVAVLNCRIEIVFAHFECLTIAETWNGIEVHHFLQEIRILFKLLNCVDTCFLFLLSTTAFIHTFLSDILIFTRITNKNLSFLPLLLSKKYRQYFLSKTVPVCLKEAQTTRLSELLW